MVTDFLRFFPLNLEENMELVYLTHFQVPSCLRNIGKIWAVELLLGWTNCL